MTTERERSIRSYDYELPPELVAQEPLPDREASRLMVLARPGKPPAHHVFSDLPDLLRPGDLLVTNRSRVLPARLLGRRPGGGQAEILLIRQREPDLWEALVRPGRRLKPGTRVEIAPDLAVRIEGRDPSADSGQRAVRLLAADGDAVGAIERHGHVPLPPYIRRADRSSDRERYQTVYAREPGSVAAPTAGLHFTEDLLRRLAARGIDRTEILLHVGPGTFRPVAVEDVTRHEVDPEVFAIPADAAEAIRRARAARRRIVAVGTTTTRALESANDTHGAVRAGEGETKLVITPGFSFAIVDALVTNLHLPRSSLLLLVAAFAGRERILSAYQEAIQRRYRFYSYGDAMLLL